MQKSKKMDGLTLIMYANGTPIPRPEQAIYEWLNNLFSTSTTQIDKCSCCIR
jgi:hypothetical protein